MQLYHSYSWREILRPPIPAEGEPGSLREQNLAVECFLRLRQRRRNPDRDLTWKIARHYAAFHLSRRAR